MATDTQSLRSGASPLDRFFRLREHGTNIRTEVLAGLTTFMVMSYIIAVNPATLNFNGALGTTRVATVTCLVAGVMSIAMGLYTNRAIALAPGLGINAIVAYTLVGSMGLTFPQAMGVIVSEGVIITILVLLGVRQYVVDVVPMVLKQAISVGIGFFILFIGLKDAGLVTFLSGNDTPAGTTTGLLSLSPLNTWPIFVAVIGLLVTIVLVARNVRGAILWGMLFATVLAFIVPGNVAAFPDHPLEGPDFGLVGQFSFGFIGKLGFLTALLAVLSIMLADFFDTMGTLIGVGSQAGYLDEKGDFPDVKKPLLIDSLAAAAGGAVSASSATCYIESAAGVSVGGRTGLVTVVTGLLFLLALPFVALVSAIPAAATAPALIIVGFLMVGVLSEREVVTISGQRTTHSGVNFAELEEGLPVVLTVLVMPLTFNITNGIGVGFISYVVVKVAKGKWREVHPALYLVALAFLLYFLRWALFNAKF
jgi:AGZA family xanthine/uracil permease-like MFS transporter